MGVGQSELEIVQYADTTVVVLVPESGDAIQGMKAGLMEIADIFVINKSDREGADRFAADLRAAMHLKDWGEWIPPMVSTVAVRGEGLREFHDAVTQHLDYLRQSGRFEQRRAERLRGRIRRLVEQKLASEFWTAARLQAIETAIRINRSPYEISLELLKEFR